MIQKRVIKSCYKHGEYEHVKEQNGYFRCRRCRNDAVIERRRRVKLQLIQESGGKCCVCGYNRCVGALEFHHLNPKNKIHNVSPRGRTFGFKKSLKESKKCILLCANCHREVENKVITI